MSNHREDDRRDQGGDAFQAGENAQPSLTVMPPGGSLAELLGASQAAAIEIPARFQGAPEIIRGVPDPDVRHRASEAWRLGQRLRWLIHLWMQFVTLAHSRLTVDDATQERICRHFDVLDGYQNVLASFANNAPNAGLVPVAAIDGLLTGFREEAVRIATALHVQGIVSPAFQVPIADLRQRVAAITEVTGVTANRAHLGPAVIDLNLEALTQNLSQRAAPLFHELEQFLRALRTSPLAAMQPGVPDGPRWDRRPRELWMGPNCVRRFRRPAESQTRILQAFQELGWPESVRVAGLNPDQLNQAIRDLNRGIDPPLIRFHGDGTGRGVRWAATPHGQDA